MGSHVEQPSEFWPPAADLIRDTLTFEFRDNRYTGHLVAPSPQPGPRPLVLVIHNYQGLKSFDVHVAEYLARVGYVGLAIDMYGDTVPADEREFPDDPDAVQAFQQQCFTGMVSVDHDHEFFRALLGEWLERGKQHSSVSTTYAPAAIGYCFGGMAVIEAVRGGLDLSAAVSFHGLLQTGEDPNPALWGAPRPPVKHAENPYNTNTVLMIENGAEDHLVPAHSRARFYEEMDEAGVDWIFHHYAKTPHGFALPPRIGPPGHLHEASDRRSTQAMLALFREVFPSVEQHRVDRNAAGTAIPG